MGTAVVDVCQGIIFTKKGRERGKEKGRKMEGRKERRKMEDRKEGKGETMQTEAGYDTHSVRLSSNQRKLGSSVRKGSSEIRPFSCWEKILY